MVARLGTSVPPFFIESFMRYGDYECPDKYRIEITKCLREYSSEIYDIIQSNNYNLDLTNMFSWAEALQSSSTLGITRTGM